VDAPAQDLDQARLRWLIAAMAMATLPFATDLPPWEVLGVALCAWVRTVRERRGLGAVPRLVRLPALVGVVAALWFSGALGVGLALGTPMVVAFCWLKLLEMKGERDYGLCCFLSLFLVAVLLFDQQSLISCLYALATIAVIIAALARQQVAGPAASFIAVRAGTWRLIRHALPLAALVFMLTPRLQLDLPNVTGQGVSGFVDRMRPGDIARMATSDKIAFRVEFPEGQLPNGIELYWRGLVMNSSQDGSLWRVEDAYGGGGGSHGAWSGGADLPTLMQDITLMPDGQRWLFALEEPIALSEGAGARIGNATLRHGQPVNRVLSYRVTSRLGDRPTDDDPATRTELRLMDREVVALARTLKSGTADADQAAARVLRYFAEQGFTYSLNPGAMGEDSLRHFLLVAKVGFCAHYATAFASLMRLMGYPARVVVGYHGGEVNPVGDFVVVRQGHAHAWAEVLQADGSWKHYDPTSGLPVAPGEVLNIAQRPGAAALSMSLDRTPAWLPAFLRAPWQATSQWLGYAEARWDGWFMGFDGERQAFMISALGLGHLGPLGLFALLAVAGLAALLALRGVLGRTRPGSGDDQVAALYRSWCRRLARLGLERAAWEGPLDFSARAAAALPGLAAELREAGALYARLRYRPGGDQRAELRRFQELTARLPRRRPAAAAGAAGRDQKS
jgi:transglutaminase-like putative cysteine protease